MLRNPGKRSLGLRAGFLICAAAILTIAPARDASAGGSVRAMGMGGAGTASARGLESVDWNPANLALVRPAGLEIGLFSAAVDMSNNAFTLDRYNTFTGARLSRADKDLLLSDIPAGGLVLEADVRASAMGISAGPWALTFQGMAGGSGTLDKDFFDLVLLGNEIDQAFDFGDTDGEAFAAAGATVSYARPLVTSRAMRLSAGVNVKYLQGIYDFSDVRAGGGITTAMIGIEGDAEASYRSATGGSGYAVDLGVALQAPRGWTFGLSLENGASRMTWDRDTERHLWSAAGDSLSATTDDFDDAVASYAIDSYSTDLPRKLRIGASNNFGRIAYAVDLAQSLAEKIGGASRTEINAGLEWNLKSWMQPRLGLGFGGAGGARSSVGLGLGIGPWRLDLAVGNRGRIWPDDTRGLAFALGSSLRL